MSQTIGEAIGEAILLRQIDLGPRTIPLYIIHQRKKPEFLSF